MSKSYRDSHKAKNYGTKYKELFKNDSFDARIWILEKLILKKIYQNFIIHKIENYLDFACGTGRLLEFFEHRAKNSYGIDVSQEMLKEAEKKYRNTKFFNVDLVKNQKVFGDQKFNVVSAFRFFLNAEKPLRDEILKILDNLLVDDGILILNNHGNKYSLRIFSLLINIILTFKRNFNSLSISEIREILEQNNFEIINVFGLGFQPIFFAKILPRKIWYVVENFLMNIKFLNKFGIHLIIVCKKLNKIQFSTIPP